MDSRPAKYLDGYNGAVVARIKLARKDMGMPIAELSRRSGVSLRTLHRYLDGQSELSMDAVVQLCRALRINPGEMVADVMNDLGE